MAALVFCGACSPGVSGEPVAELWDPCTIPSDAVAGAGVNAAVIDSRRVSPDSAEASFCTFRQDWFYLTIYSTRATLDDIRSSARAMSVSDTLIANRVGLMYRDATQESLDVCYASVAASFGAVEFEIAQASNSPSLGDTCGIALDVADQLTGSVPK
ncbi:DUF3558 family protein [Rhodococcus sp. BP-149]|uniref:DUF3558 family protein n=1 Tax=unclassified Rhodococcus (in: high G+C Gram-positive bacteria) TaxID=192944 RepID=UPI001C9A70B8|nr:MULTISPECIES: DUF3558 family protein [unclassified Rhodococcus (in: high G+C Gram-positive bacteria)]MBY6685257.1 DUF3558 family protein [Rhodococcus sp. BP-288]MBY6696293.1 DUF3558 family protein [Rhodococcus sp. BP-188]MBY6698157.1 DUF3558 family protein [Rhodococcus sp. BP-285]MBY6705087.1 DUF3558 family protein [Rhodococcus sp. BP-283]MBY6713026.1 DUF3558 family protein [Rhodococcus sp. BP-160]